MFQTEGIKDENEPCEFEILIIEMAELFNETKRLRNRRRMMLLRWAATKGHFSTTGTCRTRRARETTKRSALRNEL